MHGEIPERIKYPGCTIGIMGMPAPKRTSEYDVVIEQDEDGVYIAHVPELPGCHTQGDSLEEVMENASEAIALYLEHAKGRIENPLKFVGVKRVRASEKAGA
jgi:predicted RNase H-like HicB family nuclease